MIAVNSVFMVYLLSDVLMVLFGGILIDDIFLSIEGFGVLKGTHRSKWIDL